MQTETGSPTTRIESREIAIDAPRLISELHTLASFTSLARSEA